VSFNFVQDRLNLQEPPIQSQEKTQLEEQVPLLELEIQMGD
jgi:hypothetical protein